MSRAGCAGTQNRREIAGNAVAFPAICYAVRNCLPGESHKAFARHTKPTVARVSSTSVPITLRWVFYSAYTVAMNSRTKALIQK